MSTIYTKIVLLAVLILGFGFIGSSSAHAATTPLTGWAWSSNVGWISFNSGDSNAGGGPYSVSVSTSTGNTVGTLGGFAWSPNIGWVKFGGLSNFPDQTIQTGLVLNGSNQYVDVPNSGSLSVAAGGSVTMCSWVKLSRSPSGYASIMAKRSDSLTPPYAYGINFNAAKVQVYTSGTSGVQGFNYVIPVNTQTQICGVISSTASTALYVNGSLFGTSGGGGGVTSNTADLQIGRSTSNVEFFPGTQNDVRVYNRALSANEISGLYSAGPNPSTISPSNGLVEYLPFSETQGTTAYDASGKGNNGTLVNGGTWVNVPSADENAKIDFSSGAVTGWARACAGTVDGQCAAMTSRADGWDGWISMSGANYASPVAAGTGGVTFVPSTGALTGYAWGSNVLGWINFNVGSAVDGSTVPPVTIGNPPPIQGVAPTCSLNAATTPNPLTSSGGSVSLTWTSANATMCQGSNFSTGGATSNSSGVTMPISQTTIYQLACANAVNTTPLVCSTKQVSVSATNPSSGLRLFIGQTASDLAPLNESSTGHNTVTITAGTPFSLKWINDEPTDNVNYEHVTAPDGSDASSLWSQFSDGTTGEQDGIQTGSLMIGEYDFKIVSFDINNNQTPSDVVKLIVTKQKIKEI